MTCVRMIGTHTTHTTIVSTMLASSAAPIHRQTGAATVLDVGGVRP